MKLFNYMCAGMLIAALVCFNYGLLVFGICSLIDRHFPSAVIAVLFMGIEGGIFAYYIERTRK